MNRSPEDEARYQQLKAFFAPSKEQLEARAEQLQYLGAIAERWRTSPKEPDSTGGLSTYEYVAVCLAAGHPESLDDALARFLGMDAWLQRWVLQERGLSHFIGCTVGAED